MVLDLEFPSDIRVQNEALSLINAGHDLDLLCLFGGGKKQEFTHEGIKVFHRPTSTFKFNKGKGLAARLSWFDRFVERSVNTHLKGYEYDCIHIHDLPLLTGSVAAAKGRLKIVADLHENFPAALDHYAWSSPPHINRLVSPKRWQRKELNGLAETDHIIVVVEEALERLVKLGVPRQKLSVVSNTVNRVEFDQYPDNEDIIGLGEGRPSLVYVGGIDAHRGLDTIVNGMPAVLEEFPNCQLLIIGGGRTSSDLQNQVDRLGLASSVRLLGKQPVETMKSYIKAGSIGVIPHLKTKHTDTTIPHKLFQYMYQRKPVLVSNCDPLARIVQGTHSGLVYESGDASSFSASLISMLKQSKAEEAAMGENGFQAVNEAYNWANSSATLLSIYEQFV